MLEAYLHIGTEKTGTKTIQAFLAQNRAALARRGVAFTRSLGAENNRDLASYAIRTGEYLDDALVAKGITDDAAKARFQRSVEEALARELRGLGPSIPTVLFSSEHLQSRLKRPDELETLKALLDRCGLRVTRVIVYLRNQADLIWSIYSTALRNGSVAPPPTAPTNPHWRDIGDHKRTIETWAATFGEETVMPRLFERNAFVGGYLISDFAAAIDLAMDGLKEPEARNLSLTGPGQELLRGINQRLPLKPGAMTPRRQRLIQAVNDGFSGAPPPVPDALRAACDDVFGSGNEWVRELYFPARESLFAAGPDSAPATARSLSPDDALDLLAAFYRLDDGGP